MQIRSFAEAVKEAQEELMGEDPNIFLIGLGVDYPNGCDGTSGNLGKMYPERVIDIPVSENAVGGICVGAALSGLRPIFVNGRAEFALIAIDPIATQAAKWKEMFGGMAGNCPVIFRIQMGRGAGQGSQHAGQYSSFFSSITGLNVVAPSSPKMAKGLLKAAAKHDGPVVFMESRWLLGLKEEFEDEEISLTESRVLREGNDITLVSYGDGIVDCWKAAKFLEDYGISCEIIDLVSLNPIDPYKVVDSFEKTGVVIFIEMTNEPSILSYVSTFLPEHEENHIYFLNTENIPIPANIDEFYPHYGDIVELASEIKRIHIPKVNITKEECDFGPKFLLNDKF